MRIDRRGFIRVGTLAGVALAVDEGAATGTATGGVTIVSTHPSGLVANEVGAQALAGGGSVLDAVEQGVMVVEADPEDTSVGYGGYPNNEGVVELDAAIVDGVTLDAGSVAALRDIKHPVAVARKVMEETPHLLLVGEGARRFALKRGFRAENLLTPSARSAWEAIQVGNPAEQPPNHDTIGMIARAADGSMAASCTTSGLAWKMPGRVGDSPLIGHGLYCDARAGGACATGIGEEIIKVCGSYQVVEFMRQGNSPDEAIRRVIDRILRREPKNAERFIGFVALRADGEVGYAATTAGFQAAVYRGKRHELMDAPRVGPRPMAKEPAATLHNRPPSP